MGHRVGQERRGCTIVGGVEGCEGLVEGDRVEGGGVRVLGGWGREGEGEHGGDE